MDKRDIFDKVKGLVPFVISALAMAVIIIYEFVAIGAKDSFDVKDFFMTFLVNAGLLITMMTVWRPSGKDRVRNNPGSSYSQNAATYGSLVSALNSYKLNGAFRTYCARKTEELLQAKREYKLSRVGLTWQDYESWNSRPAEKEPARRIDRFRLRLLDRRRRRCVEKIQQNRVKVKTLNPLTITTDSRVRVRNSYGVSYNEVLEEGLSTAFKIVQKLVTALVLGLITFEPAKDITDAASWMFFAIKLALCLTSAWGGYRDGEHQLAVRKNAVFKRRIKLLDEFFEEQGVDPLPKAH